MFEPLDCDNVWVQQVTRLANKRMSEHSCYGKFEELQTKYILNALIEIVCALKEKK
uniref:Uncharacterized protein n=1 Tax=viral metagenome TaxID=1070528 RepID=A0A6M3KUZ2_9ZZZZ